MTTKQIEIEKLVAAFDSNVIFSKTDTNGIITDVTTAFCELSGYTKDELIGKNHNLIRHPEMPPEIFAYLWDMLKEKNSTKLEILNKKKDGTSYWVDSKFEPDFDKDGNLIGYSSLRVDITAKKELELLKNNLEVKIEEQTKDLKKQLRVVRIAERKQEELLYLIENAKGEIEQILSNILLPVLITAKKSRKILYANRYAQTQYEIPLDKLIGSDIDDVYILEGQQTQLIETLNKDGLIENFEQKFKTLKGKEFTALLSVTPIKYKNEDSYIGMVTDITKQKEMENEVRKINKHTRDSIEYASLIQSALIPQDNLFRNYFKDFFTIWDPKDIVGGDIYLFEELRDENECLLMVIDCTGHGVPGAFVTMLVKAIESTIVSTINSSKNAIVSPSEILSTFNKSMKYLLKQNDKFSVSNAGFDGQVIYYNKKDNIIKFSSARNELFYIQDDEIKIIKGDRHSVGYKDSDVNFEFTEHIIDVSKETTIYISTDGYWDQIGGEKERSFGKKRLKNLVENIYEQPMLIQKERLMSTLQQYQGDIERNDDVTFIGIKIDKEED